MYNVCTIMYTHIRSQASDWNCCVKRLFVCTTVHVPYSTYHVKTNPSQMTTFVILCQKPLRNQSKLRQSLFFHGVIAR